VHGWRTQRDRPTVDHERSRPWCERVVTAMPVSDHDLLRFERQDRPDTAAGAMLHDNSHVGSNQRVLGAAMTGSVEIDRFRKDAVLHVPNATTLQRVDRGTKSDVQGLSPDVRRRSSEEQLGDTDVHRDQVDDRARDRRNAGDSGSDPEGSCDTQVLAVGP